MANIMNSARRFTVASKAYAQSMFDNVFLEEILVLLSRANDPLAGSVSFAARGSLEMPDKYVYKLKDELILQLEEFLAVTRKGI
jgi:hypothetical protein